MLEIWGRRISGNVQLVMWTTGELGLESKRHNFDGSFGGLYTDKYGKLNSDWTVPHLVRRRQGPVGIAGCHLILVV